MTGQPLSVRIAAAYAVAGVAWILAGSTVADWMFGSDVTALTGFETAKGLFFIGSTALALWWLLSRELRHRAAAEAATAEAAQRLQSLLDQAVAALSQLVNQRDPYTAGHQERVSALSDLIARRMGLAEERLEVIRTGALLHDLGKTGIPAEILTKPGRLTPEEFALVQGHVRIGETITGTIGFHPAVHAIVAQHHERLDGTGYPRGLRGDAIAPEARIVAVADIVEAMTSHRPYRPALGVEAAVAELKALRGSRLDAEAVDAFLAILDQEPDRIATILEGRNRPR